MQKREVAMDYLPYDGKPIHRVSGHWVIVTETSMRLNQCSSQAGSMTVFSPGVAGLELIFCYVVDFLEEQLGRNSDHLHFTL